MKTIEQILASTPKKDILTLKVGNKTFTVTEEDVRWLQLNIAWKRFDSKNVVLISPNGAETHFAANGRLLSPVEANTMSLNDSLVTKMMETLTQQAVDKEYDEYYDALYSGNLD